jgi:hypothetical protein
MRSSHLKDEEIQSYVDAGRFTCADHGLHFQRCPVCQKNAEQYRLLANWLGRTEPQIRLEPDFVQTFLKQLPGVPGSGKNRRFLNAAAWSVGTAALVGLLGYLKMLKPFVDLIRMCGILLSRTPQPLFTHLRSWRQNADSFVHWLVMCGLILLSALVMDVLMRRFSEFLGSAARKKFI